MPSGFSTAVMLQMKAVGSRQNLVVADEDVRAIDVARGLDALQAAVLRVAAVVAARA
ncbi:hypothetical protein SAMN05660485_01074 [Blastococcus fimeti]|nr:hypothetical protein SAMN05660485_01074 [Blastococcus fimeti]